MSALPARILGRLSARRACIGETISALGNPAWEAASARILILRLSPFRDVDRSTAHLLLFGELRAGLPGAFLDFAFLPDRHDREVLARWGRETRGPTPWYFGAASGRTPDEFDLILVSNAFGLELVNLPVLFTASAMPLRSAQRAHGSWPLAILGGSNAAQAGALVDEDGDSLVDGIFFGEGEGAIGPLAKLLLNQSLPRRERLETAADEVRGFWPAGSPDRKVRRRILESSPPPLLSWPPLNGPEAGTARLQITAGCPGLCSFCFEGWDRRPYRELPLPEILSAAREIRKRTGSDTLEVYSFNFNTHEEVASLLFELGKVFQRVNFMSQRLDILAEMEGLLPAELAADKRSFTLGVEGISARMRAYYRKGLSDEALEGLVARLVTPGLRELKLFYILSGLETEDDLRDFAGFAESLGKARAERAPGLRILASAGYLVRLPGTPLQYAPLALDGDVLRKLVDRLEGACEAAGLEFRLAVGLDEYLADQLIALRGGALLPWLEAAPEAGIIYDGGLPRGAWDSLHRFCEAQQLLDPAFRGEKGPDYPFPLAFLEERGADTLFEEYRKANRNEDRPSCLGADCSGCGACPDAADIRRITRHRARKPSRAEIDRIGRLVGAKASFPSIAIKGVLPETLAGAGEASTAAWLLRTLARAVPGAENSVFEARSLLPREDGPFGIPPGATGWGVFTLRGPNAADLGELAQRAGFEPLPAGSAAWRPATARLELLPPDWPPEELFREFAGRSFQDWVRSDVGGWLSETHVAFTEEVVGSERRFSVAARDRKKNIVTAAVFRGGALLLEIGAKADLGALLRRFGLPLRVRILGVE